MVHQPAEDPSDDRSVATAIDDEVGRDPVEPGTGLVRRLAAADLFDQPQERLGQDVLGGARIPFDGRDERGELTVVGVVDREHAGRHIG